MVMDAFKTTAIGWLVVMVTQRALAHTVIVNTDKGKVLGKTNHVHGKKIDVFYGIPYARPPIGDLRFLHPEQIDPWSNTRDATSPPNCCIQQRDEFFGNFSGAEMWNPNTNISEDCLYLNIWTPHHHRRHHRPHKSHKAVFVWVFGGAFSSGSASLDIYDGKYLAAEYDVVVVSMQFRVGSIGYFGLGAPHSPGNAGIMDIRMSLEWIQRNIHRFGGNAHNVTLVGESSGAASIGLLMLSPIGRGLFHRAILQSAAPQVNWATISFKEGRRRSLQLAERLGCRTDRSDLKILACLRNVPASKFPTEEGHVTSGTAQFPFVPIVDGTFLSKPPMEYLRNGEFKKIPLLLGANANEGSWLLVYANKNHFNLETESLIASDSYSSLMEDLFMYYPQYPRELNHFGLDAIKFYYTDWFDSDDKRRRRDGIEHAVGDASFSCGVVEMAQIASNYQQDVYMYSIVEMAQIVSNYKQDVCVYRCGYGTHSRCPAVCWKWPRSPPATDRFSHRMSNHPRPEWMGVMHGDEISFVFRFSHRMSNHPWPGWMGVMHGDEISFVFGRPLLKSLGFSSMERKLSKRIMKMWTNFAKTGNPNIGPGEVDSGQWPKYLHNGQAYLNIDLDIVQSGSDDVIPSTSVRNGFLTQRCAFWEHYLPKLAEATSPRLYGNCSRVAASTSSQAVLHGTTSGFVLLLTSLCTVLIFT